MVQHAAKMSVASVVVAVFYLMTMPQALAEGRHGAACNYELDVGQRRTVSSGFGFGRPFGRDVFNPSSRRFR